jgi:hypothetical protein
VSLDWQRLAIDQLDWYWRTSFRPRLDGLTDAATALTQLDEAYRRWIAGVGALSTADLDRPIGSAEGPWGHRPMIDLVLHINREVIHHGAEISLLRDLYAHNSIREDD